MACSTPLQSFIHALRAAADRAFQRRLLVLSGELDWSLAQARALVKELALPEVLWVGDAAALPGALSTRQARQMLGRECDLLVFDARSGLDPDGFGAVSGCLRGGGILLLLVPAALPEPGPDALWSSPFHQRFWRVLAQEPSVLWLRQQEPPPVPVALPEREALPSAQSLVGCRTQDQADAVEALVHVVKGHRRRPLVLTSDRGRGKSSALGLAAAELLREGRSRILVTAPRRAAVDPLFERVQAELPGVQVERSRIAYRQGELLFVAPDELVQQPREADLLLVDEAAAIPAPVLEALLRQHSRIAFATTEHGYEGTGRGFSVRFRAILEACTPGWRRVRMQEPIRWAEGDPLERVVFDALLLHAEPASAAQVADIAPDDLHLTWMSGIELLADETLLAELFGLLVLAHYQTSPGDLRDLLDAPYLRVLTATCRGRVVGCLLVGEEGGLDREQAWQVWAGRRRLRGHLAPQSLASHGGLEEAARQRALRVIRIAVHPAVQGRGIGTRLLAQLAAWGEAGQWDYLASSFGATPELLAFWACSGLLPVRLGSSRDACSGTHSVLVMCPLSAAGGRLCTQARQAFLDQLPLRLADGFRDLDPPLVRALAAVGSEEASGPPITVALAAETWQELLGFAFGQRLYDSAMPALRRLAEAMLRDPAAVAAEPDEWQVLVRRVLQLRDWSEVAREQQLPGRRQVEAVLRHWLVRVLPALLPPELGPLLRRLQALS